MLQLNVLWHSYLAFHCKSAVGNSDLVGKNRFKSQLESRICEVKSSRLILIKSTWGYFNHSQLASQFLTKVTLTSTYIS